MADRGCDDACGCAVPCPGARRGEGKSGTPCAGAEITAAATRAHAGGRCVVPLSDARHVPPPDVANPDTVLLLCFG
ncbi:hypothetical protein MUK42_20212 [Musa troglodytarum]|uniref:Uncharacterized protein n=1 Tax=Musa troglodytarum TaxID=320322 RepID=A0A9E7G2N7_9LILI|nr:hypothetical protein MUK42_20212 [Musa troglodytarum]